MKSWISILLPEDEYKERKMLQFLSEGGVILFLSLIAALVFGRFYALDAELVLLLHVAIFLFYVLGRYIVSGIEFTDVATDREYKKEMKVILVKSVGFTAMFILFTPLFNMSSSTSGWIEIIGVAALAGLFLFIINYVSLKRSFNRNKELL